MKSRTALIIGAGPAGLTAAHELLTRTDIRPIVLEASDVVGGLSRTVNHCGNRMDIGGHRFFSKSERVMRWWLDMLPIEMSGAEEFTISHQGDQRGPDPRTTDKVMLVRNRKSRIFFLRRFFDYPVSLKMRTIRNLGIVRVFHILASYLMARVMPIRDERNLEQFFINRFGRQLYRTFFKSYTEKVWGVPCHKISAEWGAQRIKGLSISKTIAHAISRVLQRDRNLNQKKTETSLIERFLYPKFGPGQIWETCSDEIRRMGGEILMECRVERLLWDGSHIEGIVARDSSGDEFTLYGDYVFSTMPVKQLVQSLGDRVPQQVRAVGEGLVYRDFITIGLLVDALECGDRTKGGNQFLTDNWIYIQEPDVLVGRLQIFNNWSPYLVRDPRQVWLGMEYFCNENDPLWELPDAELQRFGIRELEKLGFIRASAIRDAVAIRVPKAYPAYFGSYGQFEVVRDYVDSIDNLFLIGRNGMHRYNNQDHSMLTAMVSVDNILEGRTDKSNIWGVNADRDYHEQFQAEGVKPPVKQPVTFDDSSVDGDSATPTASPCPSHYCAANERQGTVSSPAPETATQQT